MRGNVREERRATESQPRSTLLPGLLRSNLYFLLVAPTGALVVMMTDYILADADADAVIPSNNTSLSVPSSPGR